VLTVVSTEVTSVASADMTEVVTFFSSAADTEVISTVEEAVADIADLLPSDCFFSQLHVAESADKTAKAVIIRVKSFI
jgi:hypothetical protein